MIQWATEIKVRAERRCGELLRVSAESGGRATRETAAVKNQVASCDLIPTLTDLGLTRDQSSRYQKLAAMPDEHFESALETAKATAFRFATKADKNKTYGPQPAG